MLFNEFMIVFRYTLNARFYIWRTLNNVLLKITPFL